MKVALIASIVIALLCSAQAAQSDTPNPIVTKQLNLFPDTQPTSMSDVQGNYARAYPLEKLRMQSAVTRTTASTETAEIFGAVMHGGERKPIVPPVTLPPGQANAQEAVPTNIPGFASLGDARFVLNQIGQRSSLFKRNLKETSRHTYMRRLLVTAVMRDTNHSPASAIKGAQVGMQSKMQNSSDAAADAGQNMLAGSLTVMFASLINVANENAGSPCSSSQPVKTLSNAIWMVQSMYKHVYLSIAILLLLPGAVITNTISLVSYGILGHPEDAETKVIHPFSAIIRSIIAIFLIPATQLIVSWCIDIGNSTTYCVVQFIQPSEITNWASEQLFNPPPANAANQMVPPTYALQAAPLQGNKTGNGKLDNVSKTVSGVETQSDATRAVQTVFNFMNFCLGTGLIMIVGFQIIMTCYLFLLGPIAAAFYAWPSGVGSLFNKVFVNWVDGVVNVSLWRFWWCVIILIMYIRIMWLREMGQYDPTSQWEMMMFTAFQMLLCYVPFIPFEFRPGEMVDKAIEQAKQMTSEGGGKHAKGR
jgi:hypothetical protein